MCLHLDKCSSLQISRSHKPITASYTLNGNALVTDDLTKYLIESGGLYRGFRDTDICHFTSRFIGYYPFYFQGYGILGSIFSLLPGTLKI